MFTNCSGDCLDCWLHYMIACWAGHGDDDFVQITPDNIKRIPNKESQAIALLRLKEER